MSLLQLSQLPLQIYIFAGILAFLFLVFLLAFVARGLSLSSKLSYLTVRIPRVSAKGGALAPLFERDKSFRHLWKEFQKTLHEQKELNAQTGEFEVVALRPTVPAEMFFNTQSLVDNRLRTEFFKHLPGIFTGIGIIGTFIGLIVGLQAFQISETPAVVRASLNSLLHGVLEAFLVSAFAISLAMVVTLLEKLLLARLYRKVEELNQALDSQLRAGAGEEYLSRLVKASEESATQTKILKDALVADLKQVLSELTERQIAAATAGTTALGQTIGDKLHESLQRPLEEIALATGSLRKDQGAAVTELLTDVIAGFSQRLQDLFGGQISGINQLQQQTIQALQVAVTKLEEMASAVQTSGTQATNSMAERLGDALAGMDARQEAMTRNMAEFLEHLRQQASEAQSTTHQKLHETLDTLGATVGELVTSLQTQSANATAAHIDREERAAHRNEQSLVQMGGHVDSVMSTVAKATTEMANSVTALRTVTAESVSKMNAGADTLYVAASDFAKAGQSVAGILTQVTTVSTQLTQAAGSVAGATRSLDGSLADHKAVRDTLARMVSELQATVTAAKKEASLTTEILQKIDTAAEKLGRAQQSADSYLAKVSDVIATSHQSFAEGMKRSFSEANKQFYDELARATRLLKDQIMELQDALG